MDDARSDRRSAPAVEADVGSVAGSAPASLPGSSLANGGMLLALGSAVANGLSYAYALLLSRALGPTRYGAVAALLAAGVIAAIPASALQLVIARNIAADRRRANRLASDGLRLAAAAGLALLFLVCAAASPLSEFLHVDSPLPVVWLGLSLLPLTVTGAYQGVLLGTERYGRLSAAFALTAVGRLVAAVLAVAAGWGVSGVLAATAGATAATTLAVSQLAPTTIRRRSAKRTGRQLHEVGRAAVTISGLFVLTNTDVVLARHYLPAQTSGAYALGSLFAKASLWGLQFVPLLFFPRMARRGAPRRALLVRSSLVTVSLGITGVAAAALLAKPLISALAGSRYGSAAGPAWQFAVLGGLWALTQLLLLSELATPGASQNALLWLGVALEVILVVLLLHDNIQQLLIACMTTAVILLGAVLKRELYRARSLSTAAVGEPASLAGRR